MLTQVDIQEALYGLWIANGWNVEWNVETAAIVERLHFFDRTVPGGYIAMLWWKDGNRRGIQKEEACPPATLVIARVLDEMVVEDMYPALVACVDSALHTRTRFSSKPIAGTADS